MLINQIGGSKGKNFLKPKTDKSSKPAISGIKNKKAIPALSLPEGPSNPITDLSQFIIVGYGERKIGKTLTFSKSPGAIFMKTEPGAKGSRITQVPEDPLAIIESWEEFEGYADLIIKSPKYKTIVVDIIDKAYDLCFEHVCAELNIKHPNDLGFGQGWDAVKKEFIRVMAKLASCGKGLILLSHADDKEFLKPDGTRYNKLIPTMSKGALKWAAGIADIIVYFGYYGDIRYMTVAGSQTLEGGHRLEEHFITTKGEPIHSIPMGKNATTGYGNFVKAFNNKQEKPYNLNPEETGLSDVRAPMRKKQ
jgi:hypothetical protein